MLEQQLQLANHMKVRLVYRSSQPHTEAALTLQKLGLKPPYTEELRVLVPASQAFSDLEVYRPVFNRLKADKAVPADAQLTGYAFDPQDTDILAYVISPHPTGQGL